MRIPDGANRLRLPVNRNERWGARRKGVPVCLVPPVSDELQRHERKRSTGKTRNHPRDAIDVAVIEFVIGYWTPAIAGGLVVAMLYLAVLGWLSNATDG